jgi:hypothetical protein
LVLAAPAASFAQSNEPATRVHNGSDGAVGGSVSGSPAAVFRKADQGAGGASGKVWANSVNPSNSGDAEPTPMNVNPYGRQ